MARTASQETRIWFKQDGSFRVIAERRTDRAGSFRVRFWNVGNRFKYLPADSEDEAIQLAQSVWANYLNESQGITTKEIKTILELSEAF